MVWKASLALKLENINNNGQDPVQYCLLYKHEDLHLNPYVK